MKREFEVGDVVRYTSVFCRNIGMVTGVPIDGKVLGHSTEIGKEFGGFPVVQWHDREEADAMPVHPGNLELVTKAPPPGAYN